MTYESFREHVMRYRENVLKMFRDFDGDGDGRISEEEWVNGVRKYRLVKGDVEAASLLKDCDEDGDGYVDFDEFKKVMLPLCLMEEADIGDQMYSGTLSVPTTTTRKQVFVAGLIAGGVSRTCTAPMDRLRSLMAAGGSKTLGATNPGILGGLRAMYAAGGVRAMWQGNGANVVQVGPESAILFLLNDIYKPYFSSDPKHMTLLEKFACGAAAGATAMTLVYPMYVIQNRLLVAPEGHYKGIVDAFSKTFREEGARAFAGGYSASFVRILPYKGIDMSLYSVLRDMFVPEDKNITTAQSLLFGAAASSVSQTVTHPLLVARTRLQCQGYAGRPVLYKGLVDCLRLTVQRDGARALMAGIGPSMGKNVPAIAIQFATCEKILQALRHNDILAD
jgi:solute carrier family 25 phosphate transporter 23/24/25/41